MNQNGRPMMMNERCNKAFQLKNVPLNVGKEKGFIKHHKNNAHQHNQNL